jgi:hypothetical protein
MRGLILHQANILHILRGCVKLLPLPQPQLRAHIGTDKSKRPGSHSTKECARACVLCIKTKPKYYYCPITLVLIPQVRLVHKYPIPPWEMIHPPGGDNPVCMYTYTVYTDVCNKSLTATYQYTTSKLQVKNYLQTIL